MAIPLTPDAVQTVRGLIGWCRWVGVGNIVIGTVYAATLIVALIPLALLGAIHLALWKVQRDPHWSRDLDSSARH